MIPHTELRATDIMSSKMLTVPVNASIREAAALLIDHEISGAPVCDEIDRIVGMISLRDIARAERERVEMEAPMEADLKVVPGLMASERRSTTTPNVEAPQEIAGRIGVPYGFHVELEDPEGVREFMTPIPVTVAEDATLTDLARTMLQRRVHRVLVRNAEGKIVGLVSALDLVRGLTGLEESPAMALPRVTES
jgi:CBS domain-containing protein